MKTKHPSWRWLNFCAKNKIPSGIEKVSYKPDIEFEDEFTKMIDNSKEFDDAYSIFLSKPMKKSIQQLIMEEASDEAIENFLKIRFKKKISSILFYKKVFFDVEDINIVDLFEMLPSDERYDIPPTTNKLRTAYVLFNKGMETSVDTEDILDVILKRSFFSSENLVKNGNFDHAARMQKVALEAIKIKNNIRDAKIDEDTLREYKIEITYPKETGVPVNYNPGEDDG